MSCYCSIILHWYLNQPLAPRIIIRVMFWKRFNPQGRWRSQQRQTLQILKFQNNPKSGLKINILYFSQNFQTLSSQVRYCLRLFVKPKQYFTRIQGYVVPFYKVLVPKIDLDAYCKTGPRPAGQYKAESQKLRSLQIKITQDLLLNIVPDLACHNKCLLS